MLMLRLTWCVCVCVCACVCELQKERLTGWLHVECYVMLNRISKNRKNQSANEGTSKYGDEKVEKLRRFRAGLHHGCITFRSSLASRPVCTANTFIHFSFHCFILCTSVLNNCLWRWCYNLFVNCEIFNGIYLCSFSRVFVINTSRLRNNAYGRLLFTYQFRNGGG